MRIDEKLTDYVVDQVVRLVKTPSLAGHTDQAISYVEQELTRARIAHRRTGRRGIFAEIEGVYSASQAHVDTDLRESPTPAYALANARLGGSLGRFRLAVGIANLFDRSYVEHLSYQRDPFRNGFRIYEPGRNVYTNVSWVF